MVDQTADAGNQVGGQGKRHDEPAWREITLLPVTGGSPAHGEVVRALAPGTVAIRVPLGVARLLDGQAVWVTARNRDGSLELMRATATRSPARRDELELHDVAHLGAETRRGQPRAHVEHAVLLVQQGTRTRRTVTIDLSSGGCRVRRLPEHRYRPGQRLRAALAVDTGPAVWAETEVVRVDEGTGEIALRFLAVADADRDRLDRDVLAYLAGQGEGPQHEGQAAVSSGT